MLQHTLFVAQYARVAALIPLVIQYNSAAIIRKKQQYTCLITFGEWAMISFMVATWFITIFTDASTVFVEIGWITIAIVVSIVLGFSFRRIRLLSKKLETTGIFCNERLMFLHYGAFVSATILGSV